MIIKMPSYTQQQQSVQLFFSILVFPFSSDIQVKLWTNLERLLACKKHCLEQAKTEPEMGTVHIEPGTETLVLQ